MIYSSKSAFIQDLSKELNRVFNDYPAYRNLLKKSSITNTNDLISLAESPSNWGFICIPSNLMKIKTSKGSFQNYANTNIAGKWYLSSATNLDPSAIYLTYLDTQEIKKSYESAYAKVNNSDTGIWFSPNEKTQQIWTQRIQISGSNALPYSLVGTRGAQSKVQKSVFLVYFSEELGKLQVDADVFNQALEAVLVQNETAIFGGFVLYMYFKMIELSKRKLDLSGFSVITGGGGWSGKKGSTDIGKKIINKQEFYDILSSLGIKTFIDVYGSAESRSACSGYFDPSIGDYRYSVSGNVKMTVVDPETFESVNVRESGTPIIATPYSCEGNSLIISRQDNDLVQVLSKNKDHTVNEFTNIRRSSSRSNTQIVKDRIRYALSKLRKRTSN